LVGQFPVRKVSVVSLTVSIPIVIHPPVLARAYNGLVVMALVLVIGGHWAILQSAAWAGMIYDYSHRAPVSEAIEKTFSGKFPCKLCKFVRAGQAAEKQQELVKLETKFEYSFTSGGAWLYPPEPVCLFLPFNSSSPARFEAPLTPPPRSA
jgi:hypothetical protein